MTKLRLIGAILILVAGLGYLGERLHRESALEAINRDRAASVNTFLKERSTVPNWLEQSFDQKRQGLVKRGRIVLFAASVVAGAGVLVVVFAGAGKREAGGSEQ